MSKKQQAKNFAEIPVANDKGVQTVFKTQFNAHLFHDDHEELPSIQPSMTVPDQSMTIREIMDRHRRGLPTDTRTPIFDDENDLPDIRKMDLSELHDLREKLNEELSDIKRKQEQKHQEKQRQLLLDDLKKQLQQEQKKDSAAPSAGASDRLSDHVD